MDDLLWMAAIVLGISYPFLQIWVFLSWRGVLFILGLLPLIVMGWAYLQFQEGMRQDSNLAPIFFFLAAPPCGLWLVILSLFRR
jgi:hypothetical protein